MFYEVCVSVDVRPTVQPTAPLVIRDFTDCADRILPLIGAIFLAISRNDIPSWLSSHASRMGRIFLAVSKQTTHLKVGMKTRISDAKGGGETHLNQMPATSCHNAVRHLKLRLESKAFFRKFATPYSHLFRSRFRYHQSIVDW